MSGMHSGPNLSFLCDPNLGRLAKWLRILGFDTRYMNRWDDEIVAQSISQGRIFLTRKRKAIVCDQCIIIVNDKIYEQLVFINKLKELKKSVKPFTRCSVCNRMLHHVAPEDIKELVPEYTYKTHSVFAQCPGCSRVYWRGSHLTNIILTINSIPDS